MIKLTCPSIDKNELNAVSNVLNSNHLERGVVTSALERKIQKYFNSKFAILTSSGTSALFVGLLAAGISDGDEVITTPLSFIATSNVIILCNAKPVFVDIDINTFNLDAELIEKKITNKTKAILVVDLYGLAANYLKLQSIAKKHNLVLISDSCQAIGALHNNKYINNYTDMTVYSFFNSKNITSGEGGVLITNNAKYAEKVNLLISHGQKRGEKYNYVQVGWNLRPTDIMAAILKEQLKKLKKINKKRNDNANYLIKNLSNLKGIVLPVFQPLMQHVFSRFVIRVTNDFSLDRDGLKKRLYNEGIETEIAYPKPLYNYKHLLPYKNKNCPIADKVTKEILSLPIHQHLSKNDLNKIIMAIKK